MNEHESYISQRPCGCLTMAIVDDPDYKREVAKEVARAIRLGEKVSRVTTQQVRDMPWKCPLHAKKGERP